MWGCGPRDASCIVDVRQSALDERRSAQQAAQQPLARFWRGLARDRVKVVGQQLGICTSSKQWRVAAARSLREFGGISDFQVMLQSLLTLDRAEPGLENRVRDGLSGPTLQSRQAQE